MSLIGRALAVRNQGPPVPVTTSRSYGLAGAFTAGRPSDEALMGTYGSQGTVHSNVSLLASSTAKPVWKLYRKEPIDGRVRYTTSDAGSDQRKEVVKHQALNVLNAPALPFWTRFQLFEISGVWLETTGKSHWVVAYDERATFPMGLWPVRPDRLVPVPDKKKYLAGWIYVSPDGGERIPLGVRDVVYNRYPDPLDPVNGVGPIASVLTDVRAARHSAEWNANFFENSAVPGGVLQLDHEFEDNEFDELSSMWRESHRGVNRAHRVAVLEAGVTWVPNPLTAKDMDFANLRTVGRDVIREALGMHKVMTGVTDDVNRANAQTGEEVFASWKIVPRLDRWKDVLNYQFLPLFGSTGEGVEFDYSFPMPLNREQDNAELTAKTAAWAVLVEAGADPDDAAEIVGLPRMRMVAKPVPASAGGAGPQPPDAVPGEDDVAARLRRVLANGHVPVLTGASQ